MDSGIPLTDPSKAKQHPTIIEELLISSSLPNEEKTVARLTYEAQIVLGAGTDTTSYTLSLISFHLLSNPAMLARLEAELKTAMPYPNKLPRWQELERLPYLVVPHAIWLLL